MAVGPILYRLSSQADQFQDLTVLMDDDVLSDVVPSNIVSRQVSIAPYSAPSCPITEI